MKDRQSLSRVTNVEVQIVKMRESSGNEQFFVRLSRNDCNGGPTFTDGILEHSCWQTLKNNLPKDTCIERAWFDAGFLARFVGLESYDDIVVIGFDEEETKKLKSSMTLFRPKKKQSE